MSNENELSEKYAHGDDFVLAASFLFPDQAEVARSILRSAGLISYLENENMLRLVWAWNYGWRGLRLMVPAADLEEAYLALGVLHAGGEELISEIPINELGFTEERTSSARSRAQSGLRGRVILVIGILLSPAINSLHLIWFYIRQVRGFAR